LPNDNRVLENINTDSENIIDEHVMEVDVPTDKAMLTQKNTSDDFYENMTIYPIIERKTCAEPATVYQVLKVIHDCIDNRDDNLDLKCFPDIFCRGRNGQQREV